MFRGCMCCGVPTLLQQWATTSSPVPGRYAVAVAYVMCLSDELKLCKPHREWAMGYEALIANTYSCSAAHVTAVTDAKGASGEQRMHTDQKFRKARIHAIIDDRKRGHYRCRVGLAWLVWQLSLTCSCLIVDLQLLDQTAAAGHGFRRPVHLI